MEQFNNHPSDRPQPREARLEQLYKAAVMVAGAHEMPVALQAIVNSAREIANAQFAALGVPGARDQSMAHFVTSGVRPEVLRRIGSPPMGHGVLGVLLTEGTPIRLADIREHPAFNGYSQNHPDITSFLGVPILSAGEIVGELYLANKIGAPIFSEEDERLIQMLAAHAGAVIRTLHYQDKIRELSLVLEREQISIKLQNGVFHALQEGDLLLGSIDTSQPAQVAHQLQEVRDLLSTAMNEIQKNWQARK